MAHRPATTLGLAGAVVFVLAVGGTASAQCEATEDQAIVHSDTQVGDELGHAVAIYGNAIALGAPLEDQAANAAGAMYVFSFDGTSWLEQQKLMASDFDADDRLGFAVAMYGDVVIAGAPQDEHIGTLAGSAYVFRFNGIDWVQEQKLLPSAPAFLGQFGTSISIHGNAAAIGAPMTGTGKVFVFRYVDTQWSLEATLTASDATSGDRFGKSVALSGDVLLIGANRDDDDGTDSGSVYVFDYQGTDGWIQQQKLTASDGQAASGFGFAVSLSGNVALIGANSDIVPPFGSGAAYLFEYNGLTWNQEQKLSPTAESPADNEFGFSVAIEGNTALVGSMRDNGAQASVGAAYVYAHDGTTWTQQAKIMASNGQCGADCDQFGFAVSIHAGTAVVGANNHAPGGSGYVFSGLDNGIPDTCEEDKCPWDLNDSGSVGVSDFLLILAAWGTDPGGPPDFDGNGIVGISDLLVALSNWGPCP